MDTLLLEIGAEEIPAGYIEPALNAIRANLLAKLDKARIDHGDAHVCGTPRRLAVAVENVAPKQKSMTAEILGPPENVGFDANGEAKVPAQKFAEKVGVPLSRVKIKETDKGRYLFVKKSERGLASRTLLKEILPEVILATPFPKTMKWGDLHILFARPIHSVLALLGKQVITFTVGHVKSGRYTRGHSFMSPKKIKVSHPDEYIQLLADQQVIADIGQRRVAVEKEIAKAADQAGGAILPDPELVDINTNLVEYPAATVGRFDEEFLSVPDEVLITAMREHQKYFAITDGAGKLMPCFIAVNNTIAKDMDLVATGHQRVIRARLADAKFFYESDIKVPLDGWVEDLKRVLFQAQLGSMHAKAERVQKLAEFLADEVLRSPDLKDQYPDLKSHASRAALLTKVDLVSEVVGEFPKLQGVMGRVYAEVAGEPGEVARAIEEHYRPTRSGGKLPDTLTGALVSIADKIDSICGCFSIGLAPTGAADPYALRRQGIGIVQILLDKQLNLSLGALIAKSLALYDLGDNAQQVKTAGQVNTFLRNRMAHIMAEEGNSKDVIAAITTISADNVSDVRNRVRALEKLKTDADFEPLAAAFKRVVNIIKKSGRDLAESVSETLFEAPAESALFNAFGTVEKKVADNLNRADYEQALRNIATLRGPVDLFFEDVLVMAEEEQVRRNRLALLNAIAGLFGRFADFSKIST